MTWTSLLPDAMWAGLYAAAMAVLFTAPTRYLARTFACGLAVRIARDLLVAGGLNPNWATLVAAAVAVVVAVAITPDRAVQPVVIVASVLQLSAAAAIFNVIFELLQVSSSQGQVLADASLRLNASMGQAFTRFVAMAVGLQLGVAVARVTRRP